MCRAGSLHAGPTLTARPGRTIVRRFRENLGKTVHFVAPEIDFQSKLSVCYRPPKPCSRPGAGERNATRGACAAPSATLPHILGERPTAPQSEVMLTCAGLYLSRQVQELQGLPRHSTQQAQRRHRGKAGPDASRREQRAAHCCTWTCMPQRPAKASRMGARDYSTALGHSAGACGCSGMRRGSSCGGGLQDTAQGDRCSRFRRDAAPAAAPTQTSRPTSEVRRTARCRCGDGRGCR